MAVADWGWVLSDLFTRLKALMDEQEPPEGAFTAAQFADRTAMNTINARDRLDRLVTTGVLQCGMFRARTVNGSVRQQKLYWEKKSG